MHSNKKSLKIPKG